MYRTLAHVTCPSCGRWELDTGLVVAPAAGPVGTRPAIGRRSAPLWRPRPPEAPSSNRGSAHKRKGGTPKRKRGPKGPRTDPHEDARIFDAWKSGRFKDYADLARELHLKRRDVELAIDRHEKRIRLKE
jgi:hypothetical protein